MKNKKAVKRWWKETSPDEAEATRALALAIETLRRSYKAKFGVYPNRIVANLSGDKEGGIELIWKRGKVRRDSGGS